MNRGLLSAAVLTTLVGCSKLAEDSGNNNTASRIGETILVSPAVSADVKNVLADVNKPYPSPTGSTRPVYAPGPIPPELLKRESNETHEQK